MTKSKIEWTDRTWNPTVGCARVSPGCENCYAEKQAARVVLMSAAQGRESVYLPVVDVERRRWNRTCVTVPERLEDPLRWKKPAMAFVNSMSDLFHDDVPFEFIAAVFGVAAACPQHTFQILTKRPERAREFFARLESEAAAVGDTGGEVTPLMICVGYAQEYVNGLDCERWEWPLPNVWLGVSVEDQQRADERIPVLLECPAAVRFLSCEPLLGALDLGLSQVECQCCPDHVGKGRWIRMTKTVRSDVFWRADHGGPVPSGGVHRAHSNRHGALSVRRADGSLLGVKPGEFEFLAGIDWAIVGGESGPGARECDVDDVRSIVEQCKAADVPVFVKQIGAKPTIGTRRVTSIRDRKGANPSEWPVDLRVQQFPGGAK